MKLGMWGFALSLTVSSVAAAQPAPAQPQPLPPQPPPMPQRDPTGPPLVLGPETPPPPVPGPVAPVPQHQEPADTGRPSELAFGIGIGYVLPTSLQTPNTTSVRLRLPTGLTFEPQLVFATTSTDVDNGMTMATSNKQNEVTLGSLERYPFRVHDKVDFELVGSASISVQTSDPDGDDNTRTITTLGIGYGVALAYWFTPHWNLSVTASNPLVSYTRTRQEMTADVVTVNKSSTVGVVFDPQVALMIHLYN